MTHALFTIGALVASACVVLAYLWRASEAALWLKLMASSVAVATACYLPWSVNALLGYPRMARMADLPAKAELIAFVAQDDAGIVDLWLRNMDQSASDPRAYSVTLTAAMKKTLREAQEEMGRGGHPVLAKLKEKAGRTGLGDRLGIGDDSTIYTLAPEAMSALPPKE